MPSPPANLRIMPIRYIEEETVMAVKSIRQSIFGLIVQMRTGSNIVSPIMDLATGSFFEAPKDDNSAYNIARKGLMIVNRIKSASEEALTARAGDKTTKPVSLSISSSDWLQHIQEQ